QAQRPAAAQTLHRTGPKGGPSPPPHLRSTRTGGLGPPPAAGRRARGIAERADEVAALYHKSWDELVGFMVQDPANVQRAAILLFLAKDLERIADRVTNIAEDVVFLHTGRIVELS